MSQLSFYWSFNKKCLRSHWDLWLCYLGQICVDWDVFLMRNSKRCSCSLRMHDCELVWWFYLNLWQWNSRLRELTTCQQTSRRVRSDPLSTFWHRTQRPSWCHAVQLLSAHSDTGPNVLHDVMRYNFSQHILTQGPASFMMSCGATSLSTFWPSWCHVLQLLSAHSDKGPNVLHDVMRCNFSQHILTFMMSCGATSLSTFWPSLCHAVQLLSAHSDLHDVMRCNFSQHILTQDPTYFMMSCGATSLSTFWHRTQRPSWCHAVQLLSAHSDTGPNVLHDVMRCNFSQHILTQDPTSFMMSCGTTSLSTFWHRTQRPSWCHAVQLLSAHSDTGPNVLHDVMRCNFSQYILTQYPTSFMMSCGATSLSTFWHRTQRPSWCHAVQLLSAHSNTGPSVLHDVMRCNFSQHSRGDPQCAGRYIINTIFSSQACYKIYFNMFILYLSEIDRAKHEANVWGQLDFIWNKLILLFLKDALNWSKVAVKIYDVTKGLYFY